MNKNMRRIKNPSHDIQTWSIRPKETSTIQGGLCKRNKKVYTSITSLETHIESNHVGPTLGCTYWKPTKLNYTQRIWFKNVCTVNLKRNIEMKQILEEAQKHRKWVFFVETIEEALFFQDLRILKIEGGNTV